MAAMAMSVAACFGMAGVASADPPTPYGWYDNGSGGKYVINCAYQKVKYRIFNAAGGNEDRCLEGKQWYQPPLIFAPYGAEKLGTC